MTERTELTESTERLKESLKELLTTLLERTVGIALDTVERLADFFDDIAAHGGIKINALLGGALAAAEGRSPIWGALSRAVASLSPAAKAALIAVLVLAVILLPVTVLLVLLLLIVLAVVVAVRSPR